MWIDRRWLFLAIGVSLLANIFLIGVLSGRFIADKPESALHAAPLVVGWLRTNKILPEERKPFATVMRAHKAATEDKRRILKAAQAALQAAIAEPIYDRAKVESAFADVRRASVAVQESNQAALAEALATLSSTARASLVPPRPRS